MSGRSVRFMCIVFVLAGAVFHTPASATQTTRTIEGAWHFSSPEMEVFVEFSADGTFRQTARTKTEQETNTGRFRFDGQTLTLMPSGAPQPLYRQCRLLSPDILAIQDPQMGEIRMQRTKATSPSVPAPNPPARRDASPYGPPPSVRSNAPAAAAGQPAGPQVWLLKRSWEQNEKAFSYLLPKGWTATGGIFNVNPFQMNGPGNTVSPKLDLTVKSDERGTVSLRWVPSWNYGDLSQTPTGWGAFRPGMQYRGMPCRVLQTPTDYLGDLLRETRPRAAGVRVVATDPMREIVKIYEEKLAQTNARMQQMGVGPTRVDAATVVVEYTEDGVSYREVLSTGIVDARANAFMWSNGDTFQLRAPVDRFDRMKPLLDTIRLSKEMNPAWVQAVTKAVGDRIRAANETQQYINRVAGEIAENRRRTNAEIRHQDWLFISGQDEYRNPFTGKIERDTNYYRYRWVNNEGDVLYTDQNDFDPNRYEEYNTREWKKTPVK